MTQSDNIERTLGRIEGKLGSLDRIEHALDRHERRIGVLENWKSKMLGVAAAGSIVAGIVVKVVF